MQVFFAIAWISACICVLANDCQRQTDAPNTMRLEQRNGADKASVRCRRQSAQNTPISCFYRLLYFISSLCLSALIPDHGRVDHHRSRTTDAGLRTKVVTSTTAPLALGPRDEALRAPDEAQVLHFLTCQERKTGSCEYDRSKSTIAPLSFRDHRILRFKKVE